MLALVTGTHSTLSASSRCVPDAADLFWKQQYGCSSVDWSERVAGVLPRRAPVTMVNVGANKGYKVPEFLGLWSQRRVVDHALGWRKHLLTYAHLVKSTSLKRFSCGNCKDCRAAPPAPHNRSGARVHLLEIAPANQALLRYVLHAERLEDLVTLHTLGASNVTQRVPIVRTVFAGEERQGVLTGPKARRFARANATLHVEAVALDDLFARLQLGPIYQVSIDTEGFDALVLEGMRGAIGRRQVSLIEFEVNQMGYWMPGATERRPVRAIFAMLASAGYECYWAIGAALLPASGPCFDARLDTAPRLKWSNVVCAHEPAVVSTLSAMAHEAYRKRAAGGGADGGAAGGAAGGDAPSATGAAGGGTAGVAAGHAGARGGGRRRRRDMA